VTTDRHAPGRRSFQPLEACARTHFDIRLRVETKPGSHISIGRTESNESAPQAGNQPLPHLQIGYVTYTTTHLKKVRKNTHIVIYRHTQLIRSPVVKPVFPDTPNRAGRPAGPGRAGPGRAGPGRAKPGRLAGRPRHKLSPDVGTTSYFAVFLNCLQTDPP
jgi:hypothetical protein